MRDPSAEDASTLYFQGRNLHSRRNPRKEAQRIVERSLEHLEYDSQRPIKLFFIDPGLGYAALEAHRRFSQARCFLVYSNRELMDAAVSQMPEEMVEMDPPATIICAAKGGILSDIMRRELPDPEFLSAALIDWPSASHLPRHEMLLQEFVVTFAELQQSYVTRSFFGRRWMKNIRNNSMLPSDQRPLQQLPTDKAVVLAASGPGLNASLEVIRFFRSDIVLWALPSSLAALRANDIKPDVIVSTDGGYWAGVHLREVPPGSALVISRHAMLPGSLAGRPGSITQISLGLSIESPSPQSSALLRLSERGSVLFTALDILGFLQCEEVLLIGADMRALGIQTHCRPHSFDGYLESRTSRLAPLTGQRWLRSRGEDLKVYANWLKASGGSSRWPRIKRHSPEGAYLPVDPVNDPAEYLELRIRALRERASEDHSDSDKAVVIPEQEDPIADLRSTILRGLPDDLFSNSDNRILVDQLVHFDGIGLKDAYLEWMRGGDEAVSVSSLASRLTEDESSS
jgi:hypothetical protein